MNTSWSDEYAKSNGWHTNRKLPNRPGNRDHHPNKISKQVSTSLQIKYKVCQKEMAKQKITSGVEFMHWMSQNFDPKNETHVFLAQEIGSCLWLRSNLDHVKNRNL